MTRNNISPRVALATRGLSFSYDLKALSSDIRLEE